MDLERLVGLADLGSDGTLDEHEFALMLYLMKQCRLGGSLPGQLSDLEVKRPTTCTAARWVSRTCCLIKQTAICRCYDAALCIESVTQKPSSPSGRRSCISSTETKSRGLPSLPELPSQVGVGCGQLLPFTSQRHGRNACHAMPHSAVV